MKFAIKHYYSRGCALAILLVGCSTSSSPTQDFVLTQSALDAVKSQEVIFDTAVVGDHFDVFHAGIHSHFDDQVTYAHSIRYISANVTSKTGSQAPGTIYVRKFYAIDDTLSLGHKALTNIMLMVKHERGFYPDAGDWEYIKIKVDPTAMDPAHPYGVLQDSSKDFMRGRVHTCGDCHKVADTLGLRNFLF